MPFPTTIDAAVQLVLSKMRQETKDWLSAFSGDETDLYLELARSGFQAGMSVRALLGLWGENDELLTQLPARWKHPDSASMFFVIECWRRLREQMA